MKNDCLFCAIAAGEIPSNKAVSYTHLDVYKRQVYARVKALLG